jgi:hypothetical protein
MRTRHGIFSHCVKKESNSVSCNPSYWEARIVGWLEVDRPPHYKLMDFWSHPHGGGAAGQQQNPLTRRSQA